jgi:hypothetical protein
MLWLRQCHGAKPVGATYAYAVLGNVSVPAAANVAASVARIHVLSNTPDVQAVQGSALAYGGLPGAVATVRDGLVMGW